MEQDKTVDAGAIDGKNVQKLNAKGEEVAVSPDGSKIAYYRSNNIYTCSITGTYK
jgi:Tol biopolymer transport system component